MKIPYGVVDSDGHINEPEKELIDYLEGPYAEIKKRIHRYFPNKKGAVGGGIVATHSWLTIPSAAASAPRAPSASPPLTTGSRPPTKAAWSTSASSPPPSWPTPPSLTTTTW